MKTTKRGRRFERRLAERRKEMPAEIDGRLTMAICMALWVLHRSFNFSGDDCCAFLKEMNRLADVMDKESLYTKDIAFALKDECGIKIM